MARTAKKATPLDDVAAVQQAWAETPLDKMVEQPDPLYETAIALSQISHLGIRLLLNNHLEDALQLFERHHIVLLALKNTSVEQAYAKALAELANAQVIYDKSKGSQHEV